MSRGRVTGFVEDADDGLRRLVEALAGEDAVQRRHLQRRHGFGAEQQRRIGICRRPADERLKAGCYRIHAHFEAEVDRGQIERLCQGPNDRHLSVADMIEVLRLPGGAAGQREVDRRIVDDAGQMKPLLESRQVNHGFQQRPHRPPGVERPVETVAARAARAAQCQHLTGLGGGHDGRCLQ